MALSGAGLPVSIGTWLGVRTLANMRAAGIERTNDIVREALLNPEFAKQLLVDAPKSADSAAVTRVNNALMRGGASGLINSAQSP